MAESSEQSCEQPVQPTGNLAHLAVFDFDGTSIKGSSGFSLVRYLSLHGKLRPRVILRIIRWALAYQMNLPQNENSVRDLVFTAFEGRPVDEVNQFLSTFYDNTLAKRFRPGADQAMRDHAAAGDVVVAVSATFEPIILRMMDSHPISYQISTRMHVASDGTYTCQVEGLPVEGEEKVAALRRFADEQFGSGNWELTYAYGDHNSDYTILAAAQHPFVIDPDRPLARIARENNWPILAW